VCIVSHRCGASLMREARALPLSLSLLSLTDPVGSSALIIFLASQSRRGGSFEYTIECRGQVCGEPRVPWYGRRVLALLAPASW